MQSKKRIAVDNGGGAPPILDTNAYERNLMLLDLRGGKVPTLVEWGDGTPEDCVPYPESRHLGKASDVNNQLEANAKVCRKLGIVCHVRSIDIHVPLNFVVPQQRDNGVAEFS